MSILGLPYLCALCFGTLLTSPALLGKAGADFITNAGRRTMSTEITPLAILVMDRVGEGRLGMITTFWRSDQAKLEPSAALSTLVQQYSPKPGIVVVKVFTNSPHLPWGSFSSPYLDVTTLSVGTLTPNSHLPCCACTGCSPILTQVLLL